VRGVAFQEAGATARNLWISCVSVGDSMGIIQHKILCLPAPEAAAEENRGEIRMNSIKIF
jgi:hypothetical protein